jgi:rod shape determining protein RodA
MVSGMLPVVGAPLPLISYGGTAMMTVFLGLGMVISAMLNEKDVHD